MSTGPHVDTSANILLASIGQKSMQYVLVMAAYIRTAQDA